MIRPGSDAYVIICGCSLVHCFSRTYELLKQGPTARAVLVLGRSPGEFPMRGPQTHVVPRWGRSPGEVDLEMLQRG